MSWSYGWVQNDHGTEECYYSYGLVRYHMRVIPAAVGVGYVWSTSAVGRGRAQSGRSLDLKQGKEAAEIALQLLRDETTEQRRKKRGASDG